MKLWWLLLVLGSTFVLGVSWFIGGKLVQPVFSKIKKPEHNFPAEDVVLKSESGYEIAGWHLNSEEQKGVVVIFHGIYGSRYSMVERAQLLWNEGYSVVMVDFHSHGESGGEGITFGALEKYDVKAAVEYAKKQHPGEKVGVIAISLGGASALYASPLGVDALVLESVYSDIKDAIYNRITAHVGPYLSTLAWLPYRLLLLQFKPRLGVDIKELRPIDYLKQVDSPIFILSGDQDLYTTADETLKMHQVAKGPKELWLVPGATHEDLMTISPSEYSSQILNFFHKHLNN